MTKEANVASDSKRAKLLRISGGNPAQAPLPQFPKLPASFYRRHPEEAAELDAWHAAVIEFFKRGNTIAQ